MVFKFSFIKYGTWISLKEAINLLMDSKHTSWCIAFHTNSLFLCLQCNMCIIITYHWQNILQKSSHVKWISLNSLSHIHINALHSLQQISITTLLILKSHLHLGLPSGLFLLRFPTRITYNCLHLYTCHISCPSQATRFDHPKSEEVKSWSSSLCNILHPDRQRYHPLHLVLEPP